MYCKGFGLSSTWQYASKDGSVIGKGRETDDKETCDDYDQVIVFHGLCVVGEDFMLDFLEGQGLGVEVE
jgi:hypothetical protein